MGDPVEEKRARLRLEAGQRFSEIEQPARKVWDLAKQAADARLAARVGPARKKADEIIAAAEKAYREVEAPAKAEYELIHNPARERYEQLAHPARDAYYAECRAIDKGERD